MASQGRQGTSQVSGARRQYSEGDKAAALAFWDASRGNLSQAARLANVPRGTLRRWVSEREFASKEEETGEEAGVSGEEAGATAPLRPPFFTGATAPSTSAKSAKGEVLRRWEELRDACFEDLGVARIEASFRDLVTAAKAATDMALLLRGTFDDDDIEELLAEFVSIVKKHVKDETTQAAIAEELRAAATSRRERS